MITEFFERLLTSNRGSRDDVKRRLKLVLAHDRSTLNASTLEKMSEEILVVVSKYVELDTDSLEFSYSGNFSRPVLERVGKSTKVLFQHLNAISC